MKNNSKSIPFILNSQKLSYPWPLEHHSPKFPSKPGVYFFLSSKGEVSYIGKAHNLRSRIQIYKLKTQKDNKTRILLSKSFGLKIILTASDLEAILVEAELIRTYQPKYNIRLKDDKSPIYICFSNNHFPRVLTARKNDLQETKDYSTTFGPFSSERQTRLILKISRKIFPFCNASELQKKHKNPCFYYHLNLCPGACIGKITKSEYMMNINNLKKFLKGDISNIITILRNKMENSSKQLLYEKAAIYRDQINAVQTLRDLSINQMETDDLSNDNPLIARMELKRCLSPLFFTPYSDESDDPFKRIEAYDVSNLRGNQATASMVVFSNGIPDRKQYRKFRIRWADTKNDAQMISETIIRRLIHSEWKFPDLILIDGGKVQVKYAVQSLASRGMHHKIPVIGLAKRFEHIIVYKTTFHILKLNKQSPSLHLIMHLRDEAHRFAGSYHKLLREKAMFQ